LKADLAGFGIRPKPGPSKPKTLFKQKPLKKEPLGSPRSNNLVRSRDKCIGSFEPSNIFNTRNSSLWRLRNLETWFKEQKSYEDSRYIKEYQIKI